MKKYIGLFLLLSFLLTDFLQAQSTRSGKDYAIFFYVTDFQDRNWADLPETRVESNAIANELRNNYGFQVDMVANPTRLEILNKIKTVNSRRYKKDDQVLFFFSMHGHYEARQDEGFLIPADGKYQDFYGESWISYANLGRMITLNGAEHVLLALDACYSGAFGIRNKARPGETPWEENVDMDCQEKTNRALRYNSRLYFSSGSKKQRTPARSLFASRWLEVLRKGEEEGVLRADDIRYYLNRIDFPAPEDGSFTNHQENGNFVFVHKNACFSAKNKDAKDGQHWNQYRSSSSRELLLEHLNLYPGCSHYQTALNLIAVPNSSPTKKDDTPTPKNITTDLDNMVFVQGGTFQMGSDEQSNEKPIHSVTVSDFYINRYEVTVEEYLNFANSTNSDFPEWMEKGSSYNVNTGSNDHYKKLGDALSNPQNPIVGISWINAIKYCNWLSKQQRLQAVYTVNGDNISANWNANGYRLPTEAEWEFAARSKGKNEKWAGTSTENNLASYGNYSGEKDGYQYTAPVGSFSENNLGLFDMSGNVWEWCWDWYDKEYYSKSKNTTNPKGADTGSYRVLRGGSWYGVPSNLRCANRFNLSPDFRNNDMGFRLSRAGR